MSSPISPHVVPHEVSECQAALKELGIESDPRWASWCLIRQRSQSKMLECFSVWWTLGLWCSLFMLHIFFYLYMTVLFFFWGGNVAFTKISLSTSKRFFSKWPYWHKNMHWVYPSHSQSNLKSSNNFYISVFMLVHRCLCCFMRMFHPPAWKTLDLLCCCFLPWVTFMVLLSHNLGQSSADLKSTLMYPCVFHRLSYPHPEIQILVLRFKVLGPVLGAPFCQMLLQCSTICRAERMNVPLSQFLESTDVSELQNSKMPTSNSTFTTSFQGLSKSPIICFSTVFFLVPPKYFNVFNPTFGRDVPFAACVFNSSQ